MFFGFSFLFVRFSVILKTRDLVRFSRFSLVRFCGLKLVSVILFVIEIILRITVRLRTMFV